LKGSFKGVSLGRRGLGVFLVIGLTGELIYQGMPVVFLKRGGDTVFQWRGYLSGQSHDAFEEMAGWIKTHTSPTEVFVAPPWEYRFWILAERPQVASFKLVPVNHQIKEWYLRLVDLNGGRAFETKGPGAFDELKTNYPRLSAAELLQLREKYKANYYLTVHPREDLPFALVHANRSFYLYDLGGGTTHGL